MHIPDFMPNLRHGTGATPEDGGCLMQVASFLYNGEWIDHTPCVDPALRSLAIHANDATPEKDRQELLRHVPRLLGTANDSIHPEQNEILWEFYSDLATRMELFYPMKPPQNKMGARCAGEKRGLQYCWDAFRDEGVVDHIDRDFVMGLAMQYIGLTSQVMQHCGISPAEVLDAALTGWEKMTGREPQEVPMADWRRVANVMC